MTDSDAKGTNTQKAGTLPRPPTELEYTSVRDAMPPTAQVQILQSIQDNDLLQSFDDVKVSREWKTQNTMNTLRSQGNISEKLSVGKASSLCNVASVRAKVCQEETEEARETRIAIKTKKHTRTELTQGSKSSRSRSRSQCNKLTPTERKDAEACKEVEKQTIGKVQATSSLSFNYHPTPPCTKCSDFESLTLTKDKQIKALQAEVSQLKSELDTLRQASAQHDIWKQRVKQELQSISANYHLYAESHQKHTKLQHDFE